MTYPRLFLEVLGLMVIGACIDFVLHLLGVLK